MPRWYFNGDAICRLVFREEAGSCFEGVSIRDDAPEPYMDVLEGVPMKQLGGSGQSTAFAIRNRSYIYWNLCTHACKYGSCSVDGVLDVLLAVRRGNEAGFKCRGREVNPGLQHAVEKALEGFHIAIHDLIK